MKTHPNLRLRSAVLPATLVLASIVALVPLTRAQQPVPPPPAAAPVPPPPSDQPDIFDAIKKGADKLQKEARKTRDIEPELRQIIERQGDLMREVAESKRELAARDKEILREFDESKRELTAVLTKQQDVIIELARAVEKLESEVKAHHAAEAKVSEVSPAQTGALPVTEPAVKPTPASTPQP